MKLESNIRTDLNNLLWLSIL